MSERTTPPEQPSVVEADEDPANRLDRVLQRVAEIPFVSRLIDGLEGLDTEFTTEERASRKHGHRP